MADQWDAFVIYVNAYYAVQEAYDSARRNWEKPADGLDAFCRDGNPFLWDARSSAEEAIYEDFSKAFCARYKSLLCTGEEGYSFAREWLRSLEGDTYGTSLVSSFETITTPKDFARACLPVERQIHARASRLELTPQDLPEQTPAIVPKTPTRADIESVIALLAHGDEAFAQSLRDRLNDNEEEE